MGSDTPLDNNRCLQGVASNAETETSAGDQGGGEFRQSFPSQYLNMSRSGNGSSLEQSEIGEDEVGAPGVSEVCAVDKDSGNGKPEVSPEFRCRVELCARNSRESWGHTQKVKKTLWAFFVPNETAKPGTDPTAYRSGSLEVACILCHASKTGALHPEFPVCKDEEQLRNDEDVDSWTASLSKDKQGRVPKSVFFYKTPRRQWHSKIPRECLPLSGAACGKVRCPVSFPE